MTLASFVDAVGACGVATLVVVLVACAPDRDRTSLDLVTIDTLRADHLEPYGYLRPTSPFLSKLADESFVFTDAISQCGTTPQSLSSLMTGLFPYTDGLLEKRGQFLFLHPESQTLAAILAARGYRTHAITASIQASIATGVDLGFESFDGIDVETRGAPIEHRMADEISDLALEWLGANAGSRTPFFLWLHYLDPHYPYAAPARYDGHFTGYAPVGEGDIRSYRFDELRSKSYPLSDGKLARMVIDYDREVRYIDDALRRLFEEGLRRHLDHTLVVFTADHGEALGNHGIVTHNDLYQSILRVPLLVRLPGAESPSG
jgi:arylsulfatase